MSASQQTTNYNFPKFAGADKPAWLVDFNGAMDSIDSTIKTISDLLNTVSGETGDFATDIATLQADLATLDGALTTLQGIVSSNVLTISSNTNSIASLDSDKASKPLIVNTSLLATAWVGSSAPYTLDLTVSGVTATSIQEIALASGVTSAQLDAFSNAKIIDNGQATDTISFKAYGTKPTIDIPLTVLKLGEQHA